MKKAISFFGVLFLMPVVAVASTFYTGESYSIGPEQVELSNVYSASGRTVISGDILGDFVAVGGNVLVSGGIGGDILVAGGTTNLLGEVGGDVRMVGGNVNIVGPVSGDVHILGGQVHIISEALVGGDVAIAGGEVVLDGPISGGLRVAGGRVTINSQVGGDITVSAKELVLGSKAVILGNIRVKSSVAPKIDPAAQITGRLDFQETKSRSHSTDKASFKFIYAIFGVVVVLKFLMTLAGALVLVFVLGRMSTALTHETLSNFQRSLVYGFAVIVLAPIGAVVVMATIVGIPVGLLVLLAYGSGMILSSLLATLSIGSLVHNLFAKKSSPDVNWKTAFIGVICASALGAIPFVGWFVVCVFGLASFGSLARAFYKNVWINR